MTANYIKTQKMINMNAYGDNWLHMLLKMTGSFGCVVTSKQCIMLMSNLVSNVRKTFVVFLDTINLQRFTFCPLFIACENKCCFCFYFYEYVVIIIP